VYRDANGVRHFTDQPPSARYRLFFKGSTSSMGPRRASVSSYDDLISDAADRHGVDFSLIKAIIRAESNFNPEAVSKKGAMGLMQIMPENLKTLKIRDPFDPRENIMGGVRYVKQLLRRFNGEISLTLAAYNAGPSAVDRYKTIPPYPETEAYVKKVLKFYGEFKK